MDAGVYETWHGRQVAAARALAGITVRELAVAAHTTPTRPTFQVSPKLRHGYTSLDLWQRIRGALAERGVELIAADEHGGAGVRWSNSRRETVNCG